MPWRFEFTVDERPVNDELRGIVRLLILLPGLDLPAHGIEVALHTIHADAERIRQTNLRVCFASTGVKSPQKAMLSQTMTR